MTRGLRLYNVSNHENQDYEISVNGRLLVAVAPGEYVEFGSESESVTFDAHPVENPDKPDRYKNPMVSAYLRG